MSLFLLPLLSDNKRLGLVRGERVYTSSSLRAGELASWWVSTSWDCPSACTIKGCLYIHSTRSRYPCFHLRLWHCVQAGLWRWGALKPSVHAWAPGKYSQIYAKVTNVISTLLRDQIEFLAQLSDIFCVASKVLRDGHGDAVLIVIDLTDLEGTWVGSASSYSCPISRSLE